MSASTVTTPTHGGGGNFQFQHNSSHHHHHHDNIRVCARFRPLNKVEESLNAHLASAGVRDGSFNCIRFPSETRDRVEIKVPDALLTAVEKQENSNKGDDGFISDLMVTLGAAGAVGPSGQIVPKSESYIARSPSASSLSNAAHFGSSPSHNVSTASVSGVSTGFGTSPSNLNSAFQQSMTSHAFTYDLVFDPLVPQSTVYEEVGAPIVQDVMKGYNGTIFVYGQTGSGKTFTMMGAPLPNAPVIGERGRMGSIVNTTAGTPRRGGNAGGTGPFSPGGYQNPRTQGHSSSQALQAPPAFDLNTPEGSGIIPKAINHLFECMYSSPETVSYTVSLFFVEIYMEKVRDLLVPDPSQSSLTIREDPKSSSFYIEGCVMADVTSPEEIFSLLNYGIQNRATASTRMNVMSSRSHCLLCVSVHAFDSELNEQRIGKLFLVDLAGSEKVAKTKAEGQQLEEAKVINKSLTTLGHVINQLSTRAPHIPYRDSKLTKILQDALGGNSKTTLIVCCSPSVRNLHETLSTLRFGQRAKTVKNRAVINKQHTIEDLRLQLEAAKLEIDTLRRIGANNSPRPSLSTAENVLKEKTMLEARFAEEKKALIANVHTLEDALRDAHEAADEETDSRRQGERVTSQLKEEIRLWETEYNVLFIEHQNLQRSNRELKEQLAGERDAMTNLLQLMVDRKADVARLREATQKAVLQLQKELESSNISANMLQNDLTTLKRNHAKLTEQYAALVEERRKAKDFERSREEERSRMEKERDRAREREWQRERERAKAAEKEKDAMRDRERAKEREASERLRRDSMLPLPTSSLSRSASPNFAISDRSGGRATADSSFLPSPDLAPSSVSLGGGGSSSGYGAPTFDKVLSVVTQHQMDKLTHAAKAAKDRLAAVERQRDDLQSSLQSLMEENARLNIDLKTLTRKLQIRDEQCDNLNQGMLLESNEVARLAEINKQRDNALRVQLIQARVDCALWRSKYTAAMEEKGAKRNGFGVAEVNPLSAQLQSSPLSAAATVGQSSSSSSPHRSPPNGHNAKTSSNYESIHQDPSSHQEDHSIPMTAPSAHQQQAALKQAALSSPSEHDAAARVGSKGAGLGPAALRFAGLSAALQQGRSRGGMAIAFPSNSHAAAEATNRLLQREDSMGFNAVVSDEEEGADERGNAHAAVNAPSRVIVPPIPIPVASVPRADYNYGVYGDHHGQQRSSPSPQAPERHVNASNPHPLSPSPHPGVVGKGEDTSQLKDYGDEDDDENHRANAITNSNGHPFIVDVTSPLLAMGSSSIRLGAGGFGAPPPMPHGASIAPDGSFNKSNIIKGRQASASMGHTANSLAMGSSGMIQGGVRGRSKNATPVGGDSAGQLTAAAASPAYPHQRNSPSVGGGGAPHQEVAGSSSCSSSASSSSSRERMAGATTNDASASRQGQAQREVVFGGMRAWTDDDNDDDGAEDEARPSGGNDGHGADVHATAPDRRRSSAEDGGLRTEEDACASTKRSIAIDPEML